MTHISTIGAGMFSCFLVNDDDAEHATGRNNFIAVPNMGKFPWLKTPRHTSGVLEFELIYTPTDWTFDTFGRFLGEEKYREMAIVLMDERPASYELSPSGIGTVPNTVFYFTGQFYSLSLGGFVTDENFGDIDARRATLAVHLYSPEIIGPETIG